MRLGGFFDEPYHSPEEWIAILRSKRYGAAYSPFHVLPGGRLPSDEEIYAYREAAQQADILIAEVGAWGRNYVVEEEGERQREKGNGSSTFLQRQGAWPRACAAASGRGTPTAARRRP